MSSARNVLWIMCDQLRFDYLGCSGSTGIKTPTIDALAKRGVRFTQAYAQSTTCGPSRMSAYTGRYVRSHGATYNNIPLRVDELTIGDHLSRIGVRCLLYGKSHVEPNYVTIERLGISKTSDAGRRLIHGGFESMIRHDGDSVVDDHDTDYRAYLTERGYKGENLWKEWAATARDDNGALLNGFLYKNSRQPARISAEHSESTFLTTKAVEFITSEAASSEPWMMHLSYVKPHWPYLAPEPYHTLYGAEDVPLVNRTQTEQCLPHPFIRSFMEQNYSRVFAKEEARSCVVPTYMGLISQIDTELQRVVDALTEQKLLDNTLIIFSADHGDYLGDHWLGEKYLFHDPSVRIPLIVVDPNPSANKTRGSSSDTLVEHIDILPTLLDWFDADVPGHVLEGQSLIPLLHETEQTDSKEFVVSEYDFSFDYARHALNTPIGMSNATMISTDHWKLWHIDGAPPILFDRKNDPLETKDLGSERGYETARSKMYDRLHEWSSGRRWRTTFSNAQIEVIANRARHYDAWIEDGFLIGYWDHDAVNEELSKRDKAPKQST